MDANLESVTSQPTEGYIPLDNASLYYREVGAGQPLVIVHGGPEFSHTYFLPDLDRLSDPFRLIYYDQRGRGRSSDGVESKDVTIASELEDLESLRRHFGLEQVALLGHSWGALLAMEYAVRHPERVSHLILLNTAPASHDDCIFLRQELPRRRAPGDVEKMKAISSTAEYMEGDPDTFADYLRLHFSPTIRHPERLERVVRNLRSSFTREIILKSRAIDNHLMEETWLRSEYNILPALSRLSIPTLVIHGDYDFIPVECAAHIAEAIPGARLSVLRDCGHFSFIDRPDVLRGELTTFFHNHPMLKSTP
jgi:proline iminopeptidase